MFKFVKKVVGVLFLLIGTLFIAFAYTEIGNTFNFVFSLLLFVGCVLIAWLVFNPNRQEKELAIRLSEDEDYQQLKNIGDERACNRIRKQTITRIKEESKSRSEMRKNARSQKKYKLNQLRKKENLSAMQKNNFVSTNNNAGAKYVAAAVEGFFANVTYGVSIQGYRRSDGWQTRSRIHARKGEEDKISRELDLVASQGGYDRYRAIDDRDGRTIESA